MTDPFHAQDRRRYWIRRIEFLFDEHNYDAIYHRDDNIQTKKIIFHANYLLAKLYIDENRIEQGESYCAMAKVRLQFSTDAMRVAIRNAKTMNEMNHFNRLKTKYVRLENKIENLSQIIQKRSLI